MNSRRRFLQQMSLAALAAGATRPLLSWALPGSQAGAIDLPGEDGMIVRSLRFVDLETPVEYLNTWLTPVPHFFVRNHMHEPSELNRDDWRLTVGGEVEKPIALSLCRTLEDRDALRGEHPRVRGQRAKPAPTASPRHSVGQRRGEHSALLRSALARCARARGNQTYRQAHHVPRTRRSPGQSSTVHSEHPSEKALNADTLIATHMNGAPLTKHHGFPARALVPGWIGAASCKWLTEIKVLDSEFVGNFMSPGYRFPNQPGKPGDAVKPEDTHALTALEREVSDLWPARWGQPQGRQGRRPRSRMGGGGRHCESRSLNRRRRRLESSEPRARAGSLCVAPVEL